MARKFVCAFCVSLLFAIAAAGCGISGRFTKEEPLHNGILQDDNDFIVVGYSQIGSESDWRSANTQSFKETLTPQNGYYLLYEDAQQKQENQLKSVRNFILQEVDYIVLDPVVESGWDAGIPVIIVDRQVVVEDDSLYTCWVGSNFQKQGERAGEWLAAYLESQGRPDNVNIVTVQGTVGSTAQIGRTKGFRKVLSKHRGWKMLDSQSGEFTQAKGQEVMKYFLDTYDDIDVVVSENDNMTFGAVEAIEASGKTCGPDGEMIVISFDAVQTALQFMADGRINADFECNPLLGPLVRDIIERLQKGETVEKYQFVEEQYFDSSMDLEEILKNRVY